ncbi:hypothetical protein D3C85_1780110 [compost metagenome]
MVLNSNFQTFQPFNLQTFKPSNLQSLLSVAVGGACFNYVIMTGNFKAANFEYQLGFAFG